MIDRDGRKLIAIRNGGVGATQQLDPGDAQRLAQMHTNRQARAVLGAVAQALRQSYQATVPLAARAIDKDSRTLQQTITARLDQNNAWAQKVYAGIPDNDDPVSDLNRKKVTIALTQVRGVTKDIDETIKDSGLTGALSNALDQALGGAFARNVTPQAKRWIVRIGIGVAVLVGGVIAFKLVRTMFSGASALGEAENAAMALADAKRRKRSARSVLTVS